MTSSADRSEATTKPNEEVSNFTDYEDLPLNTIQKATISVIKAWGTIEDHHIKCINICTKAIENVLYHPSDKKYRNIKLTNKAFKRRVLDIPNGIKILKYAGFSQTKNDANKDILTVEEPKAIEELQQLTQIWLILLKTQQIWQFKSFSIPNKTAQRVKKFFNSNIIAKSLEFQSFVQNSNNLQKSANANQRYSNFANAIQLLGKEFFIGNSDSGLDDIDCSYIASLLICEILNNNFIEPSYMEMILEHDRNSNGQIMIDDDYATNGSTFDSNAIFINNKIIDELMESHTPVVEEIEAIKIFKIGDYILLKDSHLTAKVRCVITIDTVVDGGSGEWVNGIWYGVELDEEIESGHNGHWNGKRFYACPNKRGMYVQSDGILSEIIEYAADEEKVLEVKVLEEKNDSSGSDDDGKHIILDVGCGWGNFGRILNTIDIKDGNYEHLIRENIFWNIFGYDICQEMLDIAVENNFSKFYTHLQQFDCKQEMLFWKSNSVNIIVSCNCLMKDKMIGHPNETFLIEANRLLKCGGCLVVCRRFYKSHLGMQLYPYLIIAEQMGWKQLIVGRIREIFFIVWQKK